MDNDTHIGDHNREYFFTFNILNEAELMTVDQVKSFANPVLIFAYFVN